METELCKIRDVMRAINDFETAFQTRYGIGLNEGMLLCTIERAGECCSGGVAEKLGLTASNASKVIASVEEKGLIRRMLCPTDKRKMLFVLTPAGRKVLETVKRTRGGVADVMEKIGKL
jgi:DNA-binding MarR family transcriptional regulator